MSPAPLPFVVRQATDADLADVARMRVALWPDLPFETSAAEVAAILAGRRLGGMPWTLFIARDRAVARDGADGREGADGRALGFVEASLRSHADGCDPDRPVGYLEGWWVAPDARRSGVGRALVEAAMAWAASLGCVEFASDALLDNLVSRRAHAALGFAEGEPGVTFRRRIGG